VVALLRPGRTGLGGDDPGRVKRSVGPADVAASERRGTLLNLLRSLC
jgi:hypothetical protein